PSTAGPSKTTAPSRTYSPARGSARPRSCARRCRTCWRSGARTPTRRSSPRRASAPASSPAGPARRRPARRRAESRRPGALGGPSLEGPGDPRERLFRWLARPDNPYLARAFVNRVWAHYFGVGLVEPVDNFSVANPPSNEKLLDSLARYFIETKYDVRALE